MGLDLKDADRLVGWMRAHGVVKAQIGSLQLILGDSPDQLVRNQEDEEPVGSASSSTSLDPFEVIYEDQMEGKDPYMDPDLWPDGKPPILPNIDEEEK